MNYKRKVSSFELNFRKNGFCENTQILNVTKKYDMSTLNKRES